MLIKHIEMGHEQDRFARPVPRSRPRLFGGTPHPSLAPSRAVWRASQRLARPL